MLFVLLVSGPCALEYEQFGRLFQELAPAKFRHWPCPPRHTQRYAHRTAFMLWLIQYHACTCVAVPSSFACLRLSDTGQVCVHQAELVGAYTAQ